MTGKILLLYKSWLRSRHEKSMLSIQGLSREVICRMPVPIGLCLRVLRYVKLRPETSANRKGASAWNLFVIIAKNLS
jgi:hypothetical protein